jgi:Putative auto-transporter adhesin, head GIN domain
MKKFTFAIIALAVLIGLSVSGCYTIGFVHGSGAIVEKEYDYQDFTGVEVSSSFDVEVSQSNSYKVVVSTHENIIDYLDVVITGDTLKVRLKPGSYTNTDLKATVTMPELNRLALSGASRGNVKGFRSTGDFELDVSGASQLEIDMEAGQTNVEISGASRVTGQLKARNTQFEVSGASRCELNGSAEDTVLKVSGASQTLLVDFPVQNADLSVSGASRAKIFTDGVLNVNVSGASSVEYSGNPELSNVSVTGASKLNNK